MKRNLTIFPVASSSFSVVLEYESGEGALGGAVIVISSLLAPVQVCSLFSICKNKKKKDKTKLAI